MGTKCLKTSFGSLAHFKQPNKPKKEARNAVSCIDCVLKDICPYSAKRIYIDEFHKGRTGWPMNVVQPKVVNMSFANGATATFIMAIKTIKKKTRIFGSMCELFWNGAMISVTDFRTGETTNYNSLIEMITPGPFQMSGHKGGDFELIKAFLRAVRSGDASQITTGVDVSLETHALVFAAEESRKTGEIVDVGDFMKRNNINL